MASNNTKKRRRTAADTLHIGDLPIGFIVNVSAYLSKPSRAILAVAFSSPSSSWQNDILMHQQSPISTAIVSASQWDTLDFEDVNKELASKLTDDDIYAILKSVSAYDVLKRLKLCGCINITGIGLNPLRGSVVLEQIDISLVGKHEETKIKPYPKISQDAVVPILDSIISTDGCSLKYVRFPQKWQIGIIGSQRPVIDFGNRYNQYMNRRGILCTKCNKSIYLVMNWLNRILENTVICYDCLDPICHNCQLLHNDMGRCSICKKNYCTDCVPSTSCTSCTHAYCEGCEEMEDCDECGDATCEDCLYTCDGCNETRCYECRPYRSCVGYGCEKGNCLDCYDGEEYDVDHCDECDENYCSDCKLKKVKSGEFGSDCIRCSGAVCHIILEENEKLTKENEELGREVEDLRAKVERTEL